MFWKYIIGLFTFYYVAGVLSSPSHLLGAKECTWGPSYWCKNLTSAKSCSAVKHCIQTVWEHQELPEDNDDICSLCKKMVQDARDQLESNETMDEIKQVFDGTCKLMYLKPAVKICTKLADDLVPELVDTLSSQMNPQVVCSVAGLCNNAEFDRMIEDNNRKKVAESQKEAEMMAACNTCQHLGTTVKSNVDAASDEDIENYLLGRCRSMGSYSDSCSHIVMEYLPTIVDRLRHQFTVKGFCHLTTACTKSYSAVEVVPESNVGVVHLNTDAISVSVKHNEQGVKDETCDLCKQLVKHLQDILIADTTELEFKQVMQGMCKQTGKFKQQCLDIVEEYYDRIYNFIADDLNGSEICSLASICPGPGTYVNGPIWPLLPSSNLPQRPQQKQQQPLVIHQQQQVHRVEISFGDPIGSPEKAQLPLERILVPQELDTRVNGNQECEFCQYFLHYIQKVITQPYGEDGIKNIVDKVCDELPSSVGPQCKNFVSLYGDAFVAILAQEIDPSQVCPKIHLCPAQVTGERYEPTPLEGKPGCPLCLMAVEELVEKLKDNKTEESIRDALDSLCNKLPKSLQGECDQLVKQYADQLVEMLVADFNAQEVCTYLKLCPNKMKDVEWVAGPHDDPLETRPDILTNEIPNNEDAEELEQEEKEIEAPQCVLCEFIMEKLENSLENNATEGQIERAVRRVCGALPSTVRKDCQHFLDEYSPMVIHLLELALDPSEVCGAMKLCARGEALDKKAQTWLQNVRRGVEECAMCEALVGAVDALLEDPAVDRDITKYVTRVCSTLEAARRSKCTELLTSYGPSIINLILELGARPLLVCSKMGLCDADYHAAVQTPQPLIGASECTWGPSFWCASEKNANKCGTVAHCREMVWKADKPAGDEIKV